MRVTDTGQKGNKGRRRYRLPYEQKIRNSSSVRKSTDSTSSTSLVQVLGLSRNKHGTTSSVSRPACGSQRDGIGQFNAPSAGRALGHLHPVVFLAAQAPGKSLKRTEGLALTEGRRSGAARAAEGYGAGVGRASVRHWSARVCSYSSHQPPIAELHSYFPSIITRSSLHPLWSTARNPHSLLFSQLRITGSASAFS